MISICVTVKNRSRIRAGDSELSLFPNCVRSLAELTKGISCELVVCDWESDDWPLAEWLPEAARPMTNKIIYAQGYFSRGRGRNMAAESSNGNILLFIDADAFFTSKDVFKRGLAHIAEGKASFPVLFSYSDTTHTLGWWRHEGYGHCMVTREMFNRSGGWPEYDKWGNEDNDFHARISRTSPIVREEVSGFYHQWHPTENEWKDRYSRHYPAIREYVDRVAKAWDQISQIVSPGNVFILVDETRFGVAPSFARKSLPFLEHDGEYWGAPTDDDMAISEFERMRSQGTSHIVFGWMCFWWLQHYSEFDRYLRSHFRCVSESENLIVFDLTDPIP